MTNLETRLVALTDSHQGFTDGDRRCGPVLPRAEPDDGGALHRGSRKLTEPSFVDDTAVVPRYVHGVGDTHRP